MKFFLSKPSAVDKIISVHYYYGQMGRKRISFSQIKGFDWDKGNIDKNWRQHRVTNKEAEEVFSNQPLLIAEDEKHSQVEQRFVALGRTNSNRYLFIAFTIRDEKIRIISARDQGRKERREYEKALKTNS